MVGRNGEICSQKRPYPVTSYQRFLAILGLCATTRAPNLNKYSRRLLRYLVCSLSTDSPIGLAQSLGCDLTPIGALSRFHSFLLSTINVRSCLSESLLLNKYALSLRMPSSPSLAQLQLCISVFAQWVHRQGRQSVESYGVQL